MGNKKRLTLRYVAKQLNQDRSTIISLLAKAGYKVKEAPNSLITIDQYEMLAQILDISNPIAWDDDPIPKDGLLEPWAEGEPVPEWAKVPLNEGMSVAEIIAASKVQKNEAVEEPKYLQIEFEIPDHLSEEEIRSLIEKTVLNLDNAHRDLGGHGLKVKDLQIQLQERLKEVFS